MAVNIHPSLFINPKVSPGIGAFVASVRKVADERRLQHHLRIDLALSGKEVRKPERGMRNPRDEDAR
jgi:hypothetical protein